MFLYGIDHSDDTMNPGAFEKCYREISFELGESLCTNEWLTNVARLQRSTRALHADPPAFALRHSNDLLDLFRLLMDQAGETRGCITRARFVQLQSIGDFMYDAVEQSKILGSN